MIKLQTSCFVCAKKPYYFYTVNEKTKTSNREARKVASELEASGWHKKCDHPTEKDLFKNFHMASNR